MCLLNQIDFWQVSYFKTFVISRCVRGSTFQRVFVKKVCVFVWERERNTSCLHVRVCAWPPPHHHPHTHLPALRSLWYSMNKIVVLFMEYHKLLHAFWLEANWCCPIKSGPKWSSVWAALVERHRAWTACLCFYIWKHSPVCSHLLCNWTSILHKTF